MIEKNSNSNLKIAILDLNNGFENQGMRCIREIIYNWSIEKAVTVTCVEFDVRQKLETPDLNFDMYISSGGPGSPLESKNTAWENSYFNWIQSVINFNDSVLNSNKKKVLFICHSFQLACKFFNIGNVCKRVSTSFGVFPVHLVINDEQEEIFIGLQDPFYIVDSRDYQVIEPNYEVINKLGSKILAIEKNRPHVPHERAIMAIRFDENLVGTQFHPEADAIGMGMYLNREDKKATVINNHGESKWRNMVEHLKDPDKIQFTHSHIIPNFLNSTISEKVI